VEDQRASIAHSLWRIQNEGGQTNIVIFNPDNAPKYYVQFAGERGSPALHAEAVSNEFLDARSALDANQMTRLQSLGWNPPDSLPNFYQDFQVHTDEGRLQIAGHVLRTFREVYGWSGDAPISVNLILG
jgi:hypothetical protein